VQQNKVGEQKWFRLFGRFSIGCLSIVYIFFSSSVYAQSFENFKRSEINAFQEYKDKKDTEFSHYLKIQWQEYTSQYSQALYRKKKPQAIPHTRPKKIKSVGPIISIKIEKIKPQKPKVKIKTLKQDIHFLFFGEDIGFNIDKNYKKARFYPQSQVGISNFFNTLALSNYESTLNDLKRVKKTLNLNDWGLYLLIQDLSKQLYSYEDERKLFSWFFFNKLGYEVKIGISSKHVVLMHYSDKIIYSTPNYEFNKKKYYVISKYAQEFSHKVYTYKQNYPGAYKPLDLALQELPKLKKDMKMKKLSFKEFGKTYTIPYQYNKNLIDFMATYPQADYETYFNTPLSLLAYDELAEGIKKYVDTKKASVAINFVLHFVQKAFKYEVDQKQFAREKVMFANETLFYQKSDCEDRAILFARLIKHMFSISVVGVKYSDHMATALYIPLKGESVKAGNRRFIIADPTYINANIGQSMPKYSGKIPENFIYLQGTL